MIVNTNSPKYSTVYYNDGVLWNGLHESLEPRLFLTPRHDLQQLSGGGYFILYTVSRAIPQH